MSIPNLLNDDGSASMATALMMSHHGFRRDLAQFAATLERVTGGDAARVDALCEEWTRFRATLHGHHEAEDHGVFPSLRAEHPAVAATIDRLFADHRRIDPLLERGDAAFAALPGGGLAIAAASVVVDELRALLDPHLATEEGELIPHLRGAKVFPAPASAAEAALYAEGFAWAMHGIAPDVLARVEVMLPAALLERIPAARTAFAARCERVWGTAAAGAARTPIPDPSQLLP